MNDYRGKGPKNYERPDERIREDVCEALTQNMWVDATDIEVEVKYGYVYLRGTVVDRNQKKAAESCTEEVSGVVDVINDLSLKKDRGLIGDMSIKANMI
jgi:osmotically-inducible protein OsmY